MHAASAPSSAAPAKSPLLEMLAIAAPVVATMTSYTLMQFVDKLMVSRIGPDPIYVGAQGNGGLAAWAPISIMMGFVTVINTFVSQNLGASKPDRGPAYVWAGMWLNVLFWLVFLLPLGLALPHIFEFIRPDNLPPDELASAIHRDQLASGYGRILIYTSVITLCCRAVSQFFYGMHKPSVVLIASLIGNVVNFVFNTLLVYGPQAPTKIDNPLLRAWFDFSAALAQRFNIPRLELDGSAIATAIGTAIELLIPLCVFLSPKFNRLYGTARAWRFSLPHAKDLIRIGWAPALMFGNEMVCWAFFMVYLVGHFGPMHSTAGWIAHQWMTLSFMPTVGISVAITAMVGKALGAKDIALASQRAWLGLRVAVVYMSFCGLCFVLFRHTLIDWFIDSTTPPEQRTEIIRMGAAFLIATAAFQFFDGVVMSLTGALRGAGDTKWPGVVTVILSWTTIVGGGLALVRFAPGLQSLGPWIAAASYIFLLSTFIFTRFLGGKWKHIQLLDHSAAAELPLPEGGGGGMGSLDPPLPIDVLPPSTDPTHP